MNSLILKLFMLVILVKVIYSTKYVIKKSSVVLLLEGQEETIFICRVNGVIDFIEEDNNRYSTTIVNQSRIMNDEFIYSNMTRNNHVIHYIKFKTVQRTQDKYTYKCIGDKNIVRDVMVYVYYRPENPVCMTNFYTKEPEDPTILQCIYKDAYPPVATKTIFPTYTYGYSDSYSDYILGHMYRDGISVNDASNSTHKIQIITISEELDDISMFSCELYQYLPQKLNYEASEIRICYYNDSSIDNNNTGGLNSSISVYGSIILMLVCFLSSRTFN